MAKYIWPASAINKADMRLLHLARESADTYQPITKLLARAVRETYGHLGYMQDGINQNNKGG